MKPNGEGCKTTVQIKKRNNDNSIYSYSATTKKEFDSYFPSEYKEFTQEDYKTLHNNLVLYKTGNAEAGQYIVSMFHRFIKKYADFICFGYSGSKTEEEMTKYRKKQDKSVTKFINLFITKEMRKEADTTNKKNKLFAETCVKIQTLFSKFEYWDVYNELICTLLNMANKYKITEVGDKYHKENGTFHMYVNKCFHWDAYNNLSKIISDPLIHSETFSINNTGTTQHNKSREDFSTYSVNKIIIGDENNITAAVDYGSKDVVLKDESNDAKLEHVVAKADRKQALEQSEKLVLKETNSEEKDPFEMESLNFNWTNGSTCSQLFQCLTEYERELLVLSYAQNKTDSEIAMIYGRHRITIIKHKKIAIQKIQEAMKTKSITE